MTQTQGGMEPTTPVTVYVEVAVTVSRTYGEEGYSQRASDVASLVRDRVEAALMNCHVHGFDSPVQVLPPTWRS